MAQKQVTTTIEESLLKALKLEALEKNCRMNDILEDLIKKYIVDKKGE